MHEGQARGYTRRVIDVTGLVIAHAVVAVAESVHAPLGIVDESFDLCPAVSAAVAAVDVLIADSLCHISERGRVAQTVAAVGSVSVSLK